MKIVFIGIQGSGKGTQGKILEKKHGFKIYDTGKLLRNIASKDIQLGKSIKSLIDNGKHVNSKIVEDILKDVILNNQNENIILDGFVRNEGNKISVDKILGDYKVLFFNLSEELSKKRLLGRMYDKETGETFLPGTIINPTNGNILIKRADDEENVIHKRIELFYTVTMPIVELYRKKGNIIEIDASLSIDETTLKIEKELGLS